MIHELPTLHFSDDTPIPPGPEGLERTVAAARRAAPIRNVTVSGILLAQLSCLGGGFWLGNVLLLWLALGMEPSFRIAAMGPALAALAAPLLARSHACGMWELEQSAPCPLSRLVAVRLLLAGTVDWAALGLLTVLAGTGWPALVRMLPPFHCACALLYVILGRWPGRMGCAAGAGACLLLVPLFERMEPSVWEMGLAAPAAVLAGCIAAVLAARMARKLERGANAWS